MNEAERLKRIEQLLDAKAGTPEGEELDRLVNEQVEYENSPTTCARCGEPVRVLGVQSNGWVDVEPHKCPEGKRGNT